MTIQHPSDAQVREIQETGFDYWFHIKHPRLECGITVAMGQRVFQYCWNRFGAYELIVTYDEFAAATAGIDKATTAKERDHRFRQAMGHFAARQKLPLDRVFGCHIPRPNATPEPGGSNPA